MYPEKISEKQICDDLNFVLLNILDVIFLDQKHFVTVKELNKVCFLLYKNFFW